MELVDLQEEVERLRRVLGEERALRRADVTALWSAIEDLQREVRRRAAREPVGLEAAVDGLGVPQGPSTAVSVTSEATKIGSLCSCGASVQTARSSTVSSCDATVQTSGTTSPSCDSAAETVENGTPSPHEVAVKADPESGLTSSTGICMLEKNHLKHVLQFLDCAQLLLARQVCRKWKCVIDDIIEDCLETNGGNLREDSVPTSDLHLYLIARGNPIMTNLRVPSQARLDLSAVAITCENLMFADLRGFTITEESLSILVRRNKKLNKITLPASCSREQLRMLSGLSSLRRITLEAPSSDVLQCLPKKLPELGIVSLEAPLDLPQVCLPSLRRLLFRDCRKLNYTTLANMTALAPDMTTLGIVGCPDVTAGGLQLLLARLPKLQRLGIMGSEPPESERPLREPNSGLFVSIRHVKDTTVAGLMLSLAPRLAELHLADCAGMTAEPLGKLTNLQSLTLYNMPNGVITDAMLDSLHSCSKLRTLALGDLQYPPETAITAAAVSRLAVACGELWGLYLHTKNSQAVLDALLQVQADLGYVSYPGLRQQRTISLHVPVGVYSQLHDSFGVHSQTKKPPPASRIRLGKWQ